jgi:hypothetical protein
LKRAWRTADLFKQELAVERARVGERTAMLGEAVVEKLGDNQNLTHEEGEGFDALLRSLGKSESSTEKKDKHDDDEDVDTSEEESTKTAHLLYLSDDEQSAVALFVLKERDALRAIGARLRSIDAAAKAVGDDETLPVIDGTEVEGETRADATSKERIYRAKGGGGRARGGGKKEESSKKAAAKEIDEVRKKLGRHLLEYVPRSAVDIALFGRFLTKSEFREIDAAMQVAHALGTQKADIEYDYFTAMDDRAREAAAGHLGETELAASVFYKYAACDMALLRRNLGPSEKEAKQATKDAEATKKVEDHRASARTVAARAIKAITHAIALVVPTGKKNSTAALNPADFVEVVLRRDAPVSLVNAFLKPVLPDRGHDVMDVSVERLRAHANDYDRMYGVPGSVIARFVLAREPLPSVESPDSPKHALPKTAILEPSLRALAEDVEAKLLEVLPS